MTSCVLAGLVLAGCQSVNLDSNPPTGFDLTGSWKLDVALSDPPPQAKKGKHIDMPKDKRRRRGQKPGANPPLAFVTRDFPVLASRKMDIEQNMDSLGIDYDRGGYRDVSWGTRDRGYWQVSAGWEDDVLVIFSKASDQTVIERHRLNASGEVLTITVDYSDDAKKLELTRVFNLQR